MNVEVNKLSESILSAVLECISVSIALLCLRVTMSLKPIDDLMQILGIIAQVECIGLGGKITETTWRSILVACGSCGGDIARRISALVFKSMQQYNISPNALTYGQYIKSIGAKTAVSSSVTTSGQWLDPFFYLEEIGRFWFMHKASMGIQDAVFRAKFIAANGRTPTTPVSADTSSRSFYTASSTKCLSSGPVAGVEIERDHLLAIEQDLKLSRGAGLLLMLRPKGTMCDNYSPFPLLSSDINAQTTAVTTVDSISRALQARLDHMYETARAIQQRNYTASLVSSQASSAKELPTLVPLATSSNKIATKMSPSTLSLLSKIGSSLLSSTTKVNAGSSSKSNKSASSLSYGFFKKSNATSFENNRDLDPEKQNQQKTMSEKAELVKRLAAKMTLDEEDESDGGDDDEDKDSIENGLELQKDLQVESSVVSPIKDVDNSPLDTDKTPSSSAVATVSVSSDVITTSSEDAGKANLNKSMGSRHGSKTDVLHGLPVANGQFYNDTIAPIAAPESENSSDLGSISSDLLEPDALNSLILKAMGCLGNSLACLEDKSSHAAGTGSIIGIHSCTPCSECGFTLSEEEVFALWCQSNSADVHSRGVDDIDKSLDRIYCSEATGTAKRGRRDSISVMDAVMSSNAATIYCPRCLETILTPELHVVCYTTSSVEPQERITSKPALEVVWDEHVTHLSPYILYYEVETVLLNLGQKVLNGSYMHKYHPLLYWNIVWYSSRFSLPIGFIHSRSGTDNISPQLGATMDNEGSEGSYSRSIRSDTVPLPSDQEEKYLSVPIIIGWSEKIVQHKVTHTLCSRLSNAMVPCTITVRECFPAASEIDIQMLSEDVVRMLDGSLDGMRQAMLSVARCTSLFKNSSTHNTIYYNTTSFVHRSNDNAIITNSSPNHTTGSKKESEHQSTSVQRMRARVIYTTLLKLSIHFSSFRLYDKRKFNVAILFRDFSLESQYDKLYTDCVKCVLSAKDLEELGCGDEKILLSAAEYLNRETITIRALMGMLL